MTNKKYILNDMYDYNSKQIETFFNRIDQMTTNWNQLEVVRIDLLGVTHNSSKIKKLMDSIKSNKDMKDSMVCYMWAAEYGETVGEHYHFAFFLNYKSWPTFNVDWNFFSKFKEYTERLWGGSFPKLITDDDERVKNMTRIGIGKWNTNDLNKTNDVVYAVGYLFKTEHAITSDNQKHNVLSARKIGISQVKLRQRKPRGRPRKASVLSSSQ